MTSKKMSKSEHVNKVWLASAALLVGFEVKRSRAWCSFAVKKENR